MITVRQYRNDDLVAVGKLIADTFQKYNLSYASPEDQQKLLGPFRYARSKSNDHQQQIAKLIAAPMVYVAVRDKKEIVGVLRGSTEKLRSLFVDGKAHGLGIGRRLCEHFEEECRAQGSRVIRLASTLFAVPFYLRMGYRKSTGTRTTACFDGTGLPYQPMKKLL
jgi:GNAT superfamily N-acetyltransferase